MKKNVMLLAGLAIGLGTVSSWAYVDVRTQPGMSCQQYSSGGTRTIDYNAAASNSSTSSSMTVYCPLVRDNYGAAPTQINVAFQQNNPNVCGSCAFGTTNPSTGSVSWEALAYICGHDSVPQNLSVSVNSTDYWYGSEMLVCYIPPSIAPNGDSGVVSYQIQE